MSRYKAILLFGGIIIIFLLFDYIFPIREGAGSPEASPEALRLASRAWSGSSKVQGAALRRAQGGGRNAGMLDENIYETDNSLNTGMALPLRELILDDIKEVDVDDDVAEEAEEAESVSPSLPTEPQQEPGIKVTKPSNPFAQAEQISEDGHPLVMTNVNVSCGGGNITNKCNKLKRDLDNAFRVGENNSLPGAELGMDEYTPVSQENFQNMNMHPYPF